MADTAPIKLDTDEHGKVITNPIAGYGMKTVAGTLGFFVVQFHPDETSVLTGAKPQQIQFVLTAAQALEIGQELTRLGKTLLDPVPDGQPLN